MNDLDTRVRQAFDSVTVPDDVKRSALTYIACVAEAAEQQAASAATPAVPAPCPRPNVLHVSARALASSCCAVL